MASWASPLYETTYHVARRFEALKKEIYSKMIDIPGPDRKYLHQHIFK